MAWIYEQKFDGLNSASLPVQDSWVNVSNGGDFVVSTISPLEGTKSVYAPTTVAGNNVTTRLVTGVTDGIFYFNMMAEQSTSSGGYGIPEFKVWDGTTLMFIIRHYLGDLKAWDATGELLLQASTDNVNTRIGVEFDCSTDQVRYNVDGGTWSAWRDFSNAVTSLTKLHISVLNGAAFPMWWDDISPDYSAGGGAPAQNSAFLAFM